MIFITENIRAYELAKEQREISISEFFTKNRHLLGFDNPIRALLTTVKELVDNSLDACEEMKVLPEIIVEIIPITEDRYKVIIEDNGPGIVKEQIPRIFAKLLYGSKFFKMVQARGQQGIGCSAAVLYGQLTTGKSAKITSKIDPKKPAHYYELHIDTAHNEPEVVKEEVVNWNKEHGTKVEIELEAKYQKGGRSIEEYLKETAMVNPHLKLIYISPEKEKIIYNRATSELPKETKSIRPHPHGIELGMLLSMLKKTPARTLQSFLTNDFCRVGSKTAKSICEGAGINTNARPKRIAREEAEQLLQSIKKTRLISPPTDCLSPIGAELLEKGLKKEVNADFFCAITRPPSVYRGYPFQIEAAIVFGGDLDKESPVEIIRFANRVPLLYQQGACAITKSVQQTKWRNYGLQQSGNNIPAGPAIILVHIACVWVPFTSESKEAIAHYPEIIKEIKLALQECGRKLSIYIHKKHFAGLENKKRFYIKKYLPHIGIALKDILNLSEIEKQKVLKILEEILEKTRVKLDQGFKKELINGEKNETEE